MSKRFSPSKSSPAPVRFGSGKNGCLTVDEAGQFLSGDLHDDEREVAIKHLALCDPCRDLLVEMFRLSFAPVSEKERVLLESVPPMEEGEELRKIMGMMPSRPESPSFGEQIFDKIRHLISVPALPRPAWGFALVLLLALGLSLGKGPYKEWRGQVHMKSGMLELQKEWTITSDDLRPAGDFPLSIFSRTHSGGREENIDPVLAEFRKSLAWDPQNRDARRGLATYWYFRGNSLAADSLLRALLAEDASDSEAWNNLGLVSAREEDSTAALAAFDKALQIRPDFREAAFNRAALLQELGRVEEARQAWRGYLRIDSESQWAEIARRKMAN